MMFKFILIYFLFFQCLYHNYLYAMEADDLGAEDASWELPSPRERHKRYHKNKEEVFSETKQFKIQENTFPTITFQEFTDFFRLSPTIENNLYQKYSQEIPDFDDSQLSEDQKERLRNVCSIPKESLKKITKCNIFKVVYYIMCGYHHATIKEKLNLKSLSNISTARLMAYKKDFLTIQEFELSGGKLEVIHSHAADFMKTAYKIYASHIPDFDGSQLSEDQKERLEKFCSASSKDFPQGIPSTFKIIYYTMLGINHYKIKEILSLNSISRIISAKKMALSKNFLTSEEIVISGGFTKISQSALIAEPAPSVLYTTYSQEIPDFDDSQLSKDQKERLRNVCSIPKESLQKITRCNTFKVVYYIMCGHHHATIKKMLNFKTLSAISTARLTAYKKEILTLQEFTLSGGRLEIKPTLNPDSSEIIYKKYSDNTPDFDDCKLSENQKKRLKKFCSAPSKDFQKGKLTTFKVIYYVMRGFHHQQIRELLNHANSNGISTARLEAFNQNYLTKKELVNSGGRLKKEDE